MTARFLLDTNVLSEPVRPRPNLRVVALLRTHANEIVTASPVWHELLYGVNRLSRSRKRTLLESYLVDVVEATIPVLPYDAEAALWHANLRAQLEKEGRTPAFVDGQIAAIAAVNGLTLITANLAHFAPFPGLVVADWFGA
jgi:tRNA(fMet)-specific endonuclease VapC